MFNQIPYTMANPMYNVSPIASLANNTMPNTLGSVASKGTSLLSKINISSILTNAQKTLNVVNQAIPLYYQVKPVFNNIKTLGKIGKEFTKTNNENIRKTNVENNNSINNNINLDNQNQNDIISPTFFL